MQLKKATSRHEKKNLLLLLKTNQWFFVHNTF